MPPKRVRLEKGLFLKCLSDFVTPPGGSGRSEFPGGFALSIPLETRGFSRRTASSKLNRGEGRGRLARRVFYGQHGDSGNGTGKVKRTS